jgi:hypothetical protein
LCWKTAATSCSSSSEDSDLEKQDRAARDRTYYGLRASVVIASWLKIKLVQVTPASAFCSSDKSIVRMAIRALQQGAGLGKRSGMIRHPDQERVPCGWLFIGNIHN